MNPAQDPICHRCNIPMVKGIAIPPAIVVEDNHVYEGSHVANAPFANVWKCPSCGHSFTRATEKASDTPREYRHPNGHIIPLIQLVRLEPEWAANQILHRDQLERELTAAKADILRMEEARQHLVERSLADQTAAGKALRELAEAKAHIEGAHMDFVASEEVSNAQLVVDMAIELHECQVERDKLKAELAEVGKESAGAPLYKETQES